MKMLVSCCTIFYLIFPNLGKPEKVSKHFFKTRIPPSNISTLRVLPNSEWKFKDQDLKFNQAVKTWYCWSISGKGKNLLWPKKALVETMDCHHVHHVLRPDNLRGYAVHLHYWHCLSKLNRHHYHKKRCFFSQTFKWYAKLANEPRLCRQPFFP